MSVLLGRLIAISLIAMLGVVSIAVAADPDTETTTNTVNPTDPCHNAAVISTVAPGDTITLTAPSSTQQGVTWTYFWTIKNNQGQTITSFSSGDTQSQTISFVVPTTAPIPTYYTANLLVTAGGLEGVCVDSICKKIMVVTAPTCTITGDDSVCDKNDQTGTHKYQTADNPSPDQILQKWYVDTNPTDFQAASVGDGSFAMINWHTYTPGNHIVYSVYWGKKGHAKLGFCQKTVLVVQSPVASMTAS